MCQSESSLVCQRSTTAKAPAASFRQERWESVAFWSRARRSAPGSATWLVRFVHFMRFNRSESCVYGETVKR
jgi:hypothetical protein